MPWRSAGEARAAAPHGADIPTGQPAIPCRSARPRKCRDACRQTLSGLAATVELRLGEKSAGQLQDLVGPPQLLDLTLQFLDPLSLVGCDAFAHPGVDLRALDPVQQRLRHAADLERNRF